MREKYSTPQLEPMTKTSNADKILILSALIAHDVPQHIADRCADRMRIFRGGPKSFAAAGIAHDYSVSHITSDSPPQCVIVYSPLP